jgi:hypothetical protein
VIMGTQSEVVVTSTTFTPSGEVSVDDNAASVVGCKGNNLSDAVSESESEAELEPDPPVCDLCGPAPCDWDNYGEEIWEECNNLKEVGFENKAVRFHAYKLYTRMRHGVLRRFDHRPLPVCVHGEVMDAWPEANHVYVSFQLAMKDAADETD